MIINFLAAIGRGFYAFLESIGGVVVFFLTALINMITPPFYWRVTIKQFIEIGYFSLPVVGLTTLFTGMVLALQIFIGGSRFNAESAVATIVAIGITRELAPVMAGLMVAGRIGASIAAEIGTMRVTEQIDALITLSTNPFKYLIAPRVLAGFCVLPLLVLVGDSIGVFGGYLVGTYKLDFNQSTYIKNTLDFLHWSDIISGLVKAAIFGTIVTLMGCYHGYYSRGGAQGVGTAATQAVVSASILILIANYLITELFFAG